MYGGLKPDAQSVADRQQAINAAYDKLVQTAEVRYSMYITYAFVMCLFMSCVICVAGSAQEAGRQCKAVCTL